MTKLDDKRIRKIVEQAKQKEIRVKASFTFDANVFKQFQVACAAQNVAQSRVLEEFMKQFCEVFRK